MSQKCIIMKKSSQKKVSIVPPIKNKEFQSQNTSLFPDKNLFLSALRLKSDSIPQNSPQNSLQIAHSNTINRVSTLNSLGGKYIPNVTLKSSDYRKSSSVQLRRVNTISPLLKENKDNIWIPDFNPDSKFYFNISQCDRGVLKRVPTSNFDTKASTLKRISTCNTINISRSNTGRHKNTITQPIVQPIIESSKEDEEERRSLLDVQFYWTNQSNEDVSKKVSEISLLMKQNCDNCGKEWVEIPYEFMGFVKTKVYEKLLFIYENNQEYLIKQTERDANFNEKVTELEQWFVKIIKEKPANIRSKSKWCREQLQVIKDGKSIHFSKKLLPNLGEINLKYTISQFITDMSIRRLAKKEGIKL